MNEEARRSPKPLFIGLLCVVVALAALFGLYKLTIGRPVLIGADHVDLGYVYFNAPDGGTATHTYRLVNRLRRPIDIVDVRSSCGCTVPTISANTVEPGGELEVVTEVHLGNNGLRNESVSLFLEGRGVRTLTLSAIGRNRRQLEAFPPRVFLSPGETESVRIFAEVWEDDPPVEETRVITPDVVSAAITGWTITRPANPRTRVPGRWFGEIRLSLEAGGALAEEAAVVVTLREGQEVRVPVALREESGSR